MAGVCRTVCARFTAAATLRWRCGRTSSGGDNETPGSTRERTRDLTRDEAREEQAQEVSRRAARADGKSGMARGDPGEESWVPLVLRRMRSSRRTGPAADHHTARGAVRP